MCVLSAEQIARVYGNVVYNLMFVCAGDAAGLCGVLSGPEDSSSGFS